MTLVLFCPVTGLTVFSVTEEGKYRNTHSRLIYAKAGKAMIKKTRKNRKSHNII